MNWATMSPHDRWVFLGTPRLVIISTSNSVVLLSTMNWNEFVNTKTMLLKAEVEFTSLVEFTK